MDEEAFFERLSSNADEPAELFEHFEQCTFDGGEYHALSSSRHGVERGTVVVPDANAIVRGFPSIPRVLVLETGVPSFFDAERVVLEEKLDGMNVRIANVDGEPWAFTRSGYVCPYTTTRARTLLDLDAFFADHPTTCVCAELVGSETPYTNTDYDDVDSHEFRVFDLRDRETGDPLPVDERRRRCDEYAFPKPRSFGTHAVADAVEAARDAIDELDADGREGLVVKSADGTELVKYTTEHQHHAELAYAFSLPFDYGRDFLFSRIVRDAFQAVEHDEDDDRLRERAHDLGEAILEPFVETIRDVDADEPVGERRTVRGAPESVDALLDHLRNQSLTLAVESDRREDGERVVDFLVLSESTRDTVQYHLDGGTRDN